MHPAVLSLCIPICVHVYVGKHAFGFLCTGWGQKSVLSVFLSHLSILFFETGVPTDPGAHQLARLAGQKVPAILLSLPPQH